jgi:hypothetical protein
MHLPHSSELSRFASGQQPKRRKSLSHVLNLSSSACALTGEILLASPTPSSYPQYCWNAIEQRSARLTQPSIMMEYMTERLASHSHEELILLIKSA